MKKRTGKGRTLPLLDFSERARVRRLYISYLLLQPGGKDIRPSETPKEQLLTAACRGGRTEEIRAIYEEARYGGEALPGGLAKRMKDCMGG